MIQLNWQKIVFILLVLPSIGMNAEARRAAKRQTPSRPLMQVVCSSGFKNPWGEPTPIPGVEDDCEFLCSTRDFYSFCPTIKGQCSPVQATSFGYDGGPVGLMLIIGGDITCRIPKWAQTPMPQ